MYLPLSVYSLKAHFYVFRWEEELLFKCRSISAIVLRFEYKSKISKITVKS